MVYDSPRSQPFAGFKASGKLCPVLLTPILLDTMYHGLRRLTECSIAGRGQASQAADLANCVVYGPGFGV